MKRELLVGTRKGLFVVTGDENGFEVGPRSFEGQVVEYALRDPRSDLCLASVTPGWFGPHVFVAEDPTGEWKEAEGPAFPEDTGATVERTWTIEPGEEDGVLWAGVDPAALFKSTDSGRSWSLVRSLWDEPTRPQWQPGGGGLCLHSVSTWPGDPARLALAISAVGVWLTDDGGESWRRGVKGLVPGYLPEDASEEDASNLCVHKIRRSPLQPDTIYMQFHGGVYRSDDAGQTWQDIGAGLPSDFGFPLVAHPRDPDRAYVIPLKADIDRVPPEGKLRVYETRDRGESWTALSDGLPQDNAWHTILRQAFCTDDRDPLGLFFGATSGELFASLDEGRTWEVAARGLPPILSVTAA
jgi:hypothetical protein